MGSLGFGALTSVALKCWFSDESLIRVFIWIAIDSMFEQATGALKKNLMIRSWSIFN